MNKKKPNPTVILCALLGQQAVMGLVGVWLAIRMTLLDFRQLAPGINVVAYGLALAAALVALAIGAKRFLPLHMARLETTVVTLWRKIGVHFTSTTIVLVALGAGIGEELLFRGALQGYLVTQMPAMPAVLVASLVFGVVHAVSAAYFVAASIIGLVLGSAFYVTGNLLVVIIAHTVYDIWALRRLGLLLREPGNKPG